MIRMLLLALSFFAALPVIAASPMEAREDHIAGLRYLVLETGSARQGDALPMVIGLHYSSARPEVMTEYFDQIDFPVRIVLPQGPYPRRGGYTWIPDTSDPNAQSKAIFAVEESLSAFVTAVRDSHPTLGKPIVMGISYGGDLSLLLALRHPAQIRAAFPVAARLLPEWMPRVNSCQPACPFIHAMHGDRDQTVPVGPTQRAITRLQRLGFDAEIKVYPGVAHDLDARQERDLIRSLRRLLNQKQY
jgi:phospholipase/carboxylesterase